MTSKDHGGRLRRPDRADRGPESSGAASRPVASAAASTVSLTPIAPKIVTVPNVMGVPLNDAGQVLNSLGFTDIRAVRKFSAMPGTVIEQVPNEATDLPVDQLVKLMIAERIHD